MPREKSRYRDKRSSSSSSDSSYERKKYKSKYKRRSRSRDISESGSLKSKKSSSYSRHKKRSYSRSSSRERYDTKSRSKKSSRDCDSRSSSKSRSKYKSKHRTHRSRSSDRSSSREIELPVVPKKTSKDDTESKVEKAIKAAAAAGLTMTKLPTYEYKEIEVKEDMPTIHDRNLLDELNSDGFTPKNFTSSRNKKFSQNIVIDLDAQTVRVPEIEAEAPKDDSIIIFDELPSEEELTEMWIKKLYYLRKKLLKGEL